MHRLTVTIIQELLYSRMDDQVPVEWIESLAVELIDLINERAAIDWDNEYGPTNWTAQVVSRPSDVPVPLRHCVKHLKKIDFYDKYTIRVDVEASISADAEIMLESYDGSGKYLLPPKQVLALAASVVPLGAAEYLSSILTVALFAKPGAFQALAPLVLAQGKQKTHPWLENAAMGIEPTCVELALHHRWPPLTNMSLSKAFAWARSIEGFRDSYAVGRIGRAIGALRYLAVPSRGNETRIFWAVLGLEALYCRGRGEGLKEQLLAKSELFLGPRTEHKKMFGSLYKYRSAFVHGGCDFPFYNCSKEATEAYERYLNDDDRMTSLAVAILISTLQKAAGQDRKSLEFGYSLMNE